jgi:hypothetical protein
VLKPSWAARIAATYPPVPEPITITSYSFAIYLSFFLIVERGTNDTEGDAAGGASGSELPESGSSLDSCDRSLV